MSKRSVSVTWWLSFIAVKNINSSVSISDSFITQRALFLLFIRGHIFF